MRLPPRQAIAPTTTTTVAPTASTTSTSILDKAIGSTHLSWWQLVCVGLGGALALTVGVLVWWKRRQKAKEDKEQAETLEEEQKKRIKQVLERKKDKDETKGKGDSNSETGSESESHDSVSDGGTIRPSRRRRDRRGRRRKNQSDTESSDASSIQYRSRRRGGRVAGRRRWEDDRRREDSRRRDDEYRYDRNRDRHRHRRSLTPSPSPSPSPTPALPSLPKAAKKKRDNFRDSVFSSYGSMKKAAVRLKYVEAKVKLKNQLAQEDETEKVRQDKIREANREIFKERMSAEKGEESAGSSRLTATCPADEQIARYWSPPSIDHKLNLRRARALGARQLCPLHR